MLSMVTGSVIDYLDSELGSDIASITTIERMELRGRMEVLAANSISYFWKMYQKRVKYGLMPTSKQIYELNDRLTSLSALSG